MTFPKLILKPGRQKSALNYHPWIFSGAVQRYPEVTDGALVHVFADDKTLLGAGYLNRKSQIVCRLLSFGNKDPIQALKDNFIGACQLRKEMLTESTSAVRIINGEGDSIPGLIVDLYSDIVVIQVAALGIEALKPLLIELIVEHIKPRSIYEKSDLPSRSEEGMQPFEGLLYGDEISQVTIKENGNIFAVDIKDGQKTGFFLDQREMRALIGTLSHKKSVLNCFSYTGGFSVYAAKAGANRVVSVDVSESAIQQTKKNFELNAISPDAHEFIARDAFEYLRDDQETFDIVILDPPAFAKKQAHVQQACRGYSEINRQGFLKVKDGGLMLTCSCSHFIDETLFNQVLFQAARDAKRNVSIIQQHHQAFDHPVSIFHPQGGYLKSMLLRVQ